MLLLPFSLSIGLSLSLPRAPWSFSLPLAVVVSISVMIFITSVVGLIFCRLKATQSGERWSPETTTSTTAKASKKAIKQSFHSREISNYLCVFAAKHEEALCESLTADTSVSVKEGTCCLRDSWSPVCFGVFFVLSWVAVCHTSPSDSGVCLRAGKWQRRLHHGGLQSSPPGGPTRRQDAESGEGILWLIPRRRERWDGGVLHPGRPPVNSRQAVLNLILLSYNEVKCKILCLIFRICIYLKTGLLLCILFLLHAQ